ncbi:MAG: hypothetical protein JW804_05955 [Sedimentisphaerales bacterium]|nr:hypothetical protein [Sedimentisphaerales bacterium]
MDEVVMLLGNKSREILEYTLEKNIPFDFCYLDAGKWHKGRAVPLGVDEDILTVRITPKRKTQSSSILKGQMLGISFKDEYENGHDRFIFGTEVLSVIRAVDDKAIEILELEFPEEIEVIRNKSYLRVNVPEQLKIDAELCRRDYPSDNGSKAAAQVCQGWSGSLVNIAANGLSVSVDAAKGVDFSKGQYVGIKFTPQANVTPVSFNAYIRSVMPAINSNDIELDMEIVGLEATPQGRMVLQRLCNVVGIYRKIVQSQPAPKQELEVSYTPLYLA